MSTASMELLILDLSAANTSLWDLRESLIPEEIKLGLFEATAFVKAFTMKKSAPPCPEIQRRKTQNYPTIIFHKKI